MNRAAAAAVIFLACFGVYSGLIYGRLRATPDNLNYFKDLAISFNSGRFDIKECPPGTDCYDMALYKNKIYLYQPPVPAFIYMPLVKIWGRNTPDPLINAFLSALNCVLIFLIMSKLLENTKLRAKKTYSLVFAVFWAFGTVQFYMSMPGSVWFIAQTAGQAMLLSSVLCLVHGRTALSGFFFALAVFSKNSLLFYIVFMAALHIHLNGVKGLKAKAAFFLAPLLVFTFMSLAYNGARFDGQIFENGISFHKMNPAFAEDFKNHGYLSLQYLPHNLWTEVFMPPKLIDTAPFFEFSRYGFGFLWASPLFILSFAGLGAGIKNRLNIAALVSLCLTAGLIFLIMGNGWDQFASRYSLDYQLLLMFLLVPALVKWEKHLIFKAISVFLLFSSIYMNYHGVRYFVI